MCCNFLYDKSQNNNKSKLYITEKHTTKVYIKSAYVVVLSNVLRKIQNFEHMISTLLEVKR